MTGREAEVYAAAKKIEQAIRVEGLAPTVHQVVMARHRGEWPTLWRGIDELLAALKEPDREKERTNG